MAYHIVFDDPNVYELGNVQVTIAIGGVSFQDGTGVTDAVINSIADAIAPLTAGITGHDPELNRIYEDIPETTREVTIT